MEVGGSNLTCCYFQVKITMESGKIQSSMCYPFVKDYTKEDIQEFINDNSPEGSGMKFEVKKVSCEGSYLKLAFLLLTLLLV